jgi:hypothetical protein
VPAFAVVDVDAAIAAFIGQRIEPKSGCQLDAWSAGG